jgi:acetyltransferase-like isoleucine patch superfamily enzyme
MCGPSQRCCILLTPNYVRHTGHDACHGDLTFVDSILKPVSVVCLPAVCPADVCIGSRVTIGCGSAVMPGCIVGDDAVIGVRSSHCRQLSRPLTCWLAVNNDLSGLPFLRPQLD